MRYLTCSLGTVKTPLPLQGSPASLEPPSPIRYEVEKNVSSQVGI